MANEMPGLLGRKLGMTQIFDESNEIIPVTIIETGKNAVISVKTADGADGYNAVQLGIGTRKPSRTTKAVAGHFQKAGLEPSKVVQEIRLTADALGSYPAGQQVGPDAIFTPGEKVDVTGISKGRGFAGVMKRHNFRGFIRSHGTHEYFRHGGSIGTRLTPGHVIKGRKMGGHMGAAQVTVQNLTIVRVDGEQGLVYVQGGIPGANGGAVTIRKAVKIKRPRAKKR